MTTPGSFCNWSSVVGRSINTSAFRRPRKQCGVRGSAVSAVPVVHLLFTGREVWPSRRRCGSSTSEPACSPHSCPRTAGTHQSDQDRAGERRARRPVDASAEGGERSITPRPGQPRKPAPTLLFQAGYPQWGITGSTSAWEEVRRLRTRPAAQNRLCKRSTISCRLIPCVCENPCSPSAWYESRFSR